MIRLLVVDDHPVVAQGLAERYAARSGFEVVGTAGSVRAALEVVAARPVDVAIVDVQLDTLLTPRQVASLAEHCRVVLFSARAAEPWVRQLVVAGAVTAIDKSAPLEQLDRVLCDACSGRPISAAPAEGAHDPRTRLSAREYEVYRALARCRTPKEVAAMLGLACSTVYCHIDSLRRKLGVETLQEIVARAFAEPEP